MQEIVYNFFLVLAAFPFESAWNVMEGMMRVDDFDSKLVEWYNIIHRDFGDTPNGIRITNIWNIYSTLPNVIGDNQQSSTLVKALVTNYLKPSFTPFVYTRTR